MRTLVFAHRGANVIEPENTMEAFELACRLGADGLELDVHLTADGEVLVTHDENLLRCSGEDLRIAEADYAQIRKLNAGAYRQNGKRYLFPKLEEVLDLIKNQDTLLNIELKTAPEPYPGLVAKCLELVRAYKMEERCIFSSFNPYSVLEVKQLGSSAGLAFLHNYPIVEAWHYAGRYGVDLHPHYGNLQVPAYVESCHEQGIRVRTWTLDDERSLAWAYGLQVDAVMSNDVQLALDLREKYQAL